MSLSFPLHLRVLLPCLAALALLLFPRAQGIEQLLVDAAVARELNLPRLEAAHQWNLIALEPWRQARLPQVGLLALRGGDFDLAVQVFERAAFTIGLNPQGTLALGEAYWAAEQREKALQTWSGLLEQGLAPIGVYEKVAAWLRISGQLEKAAGLARSWRRVDPASGPAAYLDGVLSLALDANFSKGSLETAAQMSTDQGRRAQRLVQALAGLDPQAPVEVRWVEIGRGLGNAGEWDLALLAFERAKQENPTYAEAWAYSSEAKIRLRQDGRADLQQAEQLAPDSSAVQAFVALNYRRSGDVQQALEHFMLMAAREPRRALWQMEIGSSFADLHNIQKGLEYYHKAIELEPGNPTVWQGMARYCLQHELEVRETGLPAARQALVLAPDDPDGLDLLASILNNLGDPLNAERIWLQALEKVPDFSAALLHLGQFYLLQDRLDWAQYYLARAVQAPDLDSETSLLAQRLMARYFGWHSR